MIFWFLLCPNQKKSQTNQTILPFIYSYPSQIPFLESFFWYQLIHLELNCYFSKKLCPTPAQTVHLFSYLLKCFLCTVFLYQEKPLWWGQQFNYNLGGLKVDRRVKSHKKDSSIPDQIKASINMEAFTSLGKKSKEFSRTYRKRWQKSFGICTSLEQRQLFEQSIKFLHFLYCVIRESRKTINCWSVDLSFDSV